MRSSTANLTGVIGLSLLVTVMGQAKQQDTTSDVTVYLHNAVVATPGAIERAKLTAKSIFAAVGINIVWRPCSDDPQSGLSIHIFLTNRESGDDDSGPLAEAYPFAGSTGHISVRYDRVRNSAGVSRDLEPVLLAHVLVHEMTHVLQCLDRHAETGIMKSHWNSADYFDMRWKPLPFTPEDVELLHLGMQVLQGRPENQVIALHEGHTP